MIGRQYIKIWNAIHRWLPILLLELIRIYKFADYVDNLQIDTITFDQNVLFTNN